MVFVIAQARTRKPSLPVNSVIAFDRQINVRTISTVLARDIQIEMKQRAAVKCVCAGFVKEVNETAQLNIDKGRQWKG